MLGLPPMAHPGHPGPGRADVTIASPYPFIFCRTRKRPAAENEDPSTPVNETGPVIKRGIKRAHPRVNTRTETLNKELFKVSGGVPGRGDHNLLIDGNVNASHLPLQAALLQGLCKGYSLWGVFDGSHPKYCSGIFTILQHDRRRRRGFRGPCGVQGYSEEVG